MAMVLVCHVNAQALATVPKPGTLAFKHFLFGVDACGQAWVVEYALQQSLITQKSISTLYPTTLPEGCFHKRMSVGE